jgi:hypothetical protein
MMWMLILGSIGAALVAFSAEALRTYAWTLFAVSPFLIGYAAGAVAGKQGKRPLIGFAWGQLALLVEAVLLILLGFEGAICLIMAAPLAMAAAAAGNWIGYAMHHVPPSTHVRLSCTAMAVLPLAMVLESGRLPEPALHSVASVIEIDAQPQTVWQNVIGFTELLPPREALFRLGLAYPIRAELEGQGVGAVRRCVFSTGAFVEPITVWDEPRRLAFTVEENPPPMVELSPYGQIHPPHLDGYFFSERGQFELEGLPGGRTRLTGTTWYRQKLWPAAYWLPWSDYVIHKIHLRVLRHIRERSERPSGRGRLQ